MVANQANLPEDRQPRGRGYGVAIEGALLRREMQVRGLTGAALAKLAGIAPATVSQAVNDHRVHPRKLQAIAAALARVEPIPALVNLVGGGQPESGTELAGPAIEGGANGG